MKIYTPMRAAVVTIGLIIGAGLAVVDTFKPTVILELQEDASYYMIQFGDK